MRRASSRLMDSGRTSRSSHRPSVSAERPSATSAGFDIRIVALLAELRAHDAHHVVVGLVPRGADAPVGGAELALAPEREPDGELVARADVAVEIEIDHRLQPRRPARSPAAVGRLAAGIAVFVGEVAQRLGEQALLALEMQVDDALAQARLLRDRGNGGLRQAAVGDAADGGLDELLAALFGRRRAAPRAGAARLLRCSDLTPANSMTYETPRGPRGADLSAFRGAMQ